MQKQPELTEALTRAFMFADASVADEIHHVGMKLTAMITHAIDGTDETREPTEEDTAIVRVIGDVWLSALMGWVTGRTSAAEVTRSMDVAVACCCASRSRKGARERATHVRARWRHSTRSTSTAKRGNAGQQLLEGDPRPAGGRPRHRGSGAVPWLNVRICFGWRVTSSSSASGPNCPASRLAAP